MIQLPDDADKRALSFLSLEEGQKQNLIARLRTMPQGQLGHVVEEAFQRTDAEARFIRYLFIGDPSVGIMSSPHNKRVKPAQIG